MLGMLKVLVGWRERVPADGFGQSLADDLRFLLRFDRCRKIATTWRAPTAEERPAQNAHPVVGRFGDEAHAVAQVGGQQWIVRERDWYGWPDPPRYVFFALRDKQIWGARDFNIWPRAWTYDQFKFPGCG